MQISWSGYGSFRLQENNVTVIFDPIYEGSSFKLRKTSADLLLLGHAQTKDDVSCVSDGTFIIDSPGEYEAKGVFVTGIAYNHSSVIYWMELGGITLAWLGPVKGKDLSSAILEKIEGVDILLLPVGGGEVMSAKEAAGAINQVEPRLVIPAYFKIAGSKGLDAVDGFLKEYSPAQTTTDKFKVVKKDLMMDDTRVIVLTP